jgi:ABC-type dipeptide/oligopeptide/nickel transport system permease component
VGIAQRLISIVSLVLIVATLSFFVLRVAPGDAVSAQLEQSGASQEDIESVRRQLGLSDPLGKQYIRFITGLVRGDLGYSLVNGQSVTKLIGDRLQSTVILAFTAITFATIVGVSFGTLAAFENIASRMARAVVDLSISAPIYWTGTLAIVIFSAQLGWLPSTGTGRINALILPVFVLGFHAMGGIARVLQANVREARSAQFIQTARSKGLPEWLILRRHILRVALPPVITVIALQAGFLMSGTVITESIFVRPGIGRLLLDSVLLQDYPVVQGIIILSALVYAALNMLADHISQMVDPRLSR